MNCSGVTCRRRCSFAKHVQFGEKLFYLCVYRKQPCIRQHRPLWGCRVLCLHCGATARFQTFLCSNVTKSRCRITSPAGLQWCWSTSIPIVRQTLLGQVKVIKQGVLGNPFLKLVSERSWFSTLEDHGAHNTSVNTQWGRFMKTV